VSNKRINKKQGKYRKQPYYRPSSSKPQTLDDIKKVQDQERYYREVYAKTQEALRLVDLTKNVSKTFQVFSKEKLRQFLRSPQQNSNNLIQLSRFLKRYCRSYDRLIQYNASMVRPEYYTIAPEMDISEPTQDDDAILKNYYDTCLEMRKLNLKGQAKSILDEYWTVGAVYCYKYQDDKDTLWYILDPEYCKPASQNYDGSLNFAFDFSYLRKNEALLDFWDKEFTQKYNKYNNDSSLRWQELEPEKTFCLKAGMNNIDLVMPPLTPLFEQMIDLVDLQGLTAQRDALSTYKLVWAKLDTLANAEQADEWSVDPITAISYYNRMTNEALPEGISYAISPLKLEALNFKDDDTRENNLINKALKNLFKNSGGSQILDSTEVSGTQGYMSACIADEMMATREVLPMLEAIANRHIEYNLKGHDHISFIQVSPYTKKDLIDSMLKGAQYSLPLKMACASLMDLDPLQVIQNAYFENKVLKLQDLFVPLNSSFINPGNSTTQNVAEGKTDPETGGAPVKDDVTAEGDKTRTRKDK